MPHPDDFLYWPCGTHCYRHELPQMTHMSDDYMVIEVFSPYYDDAEEIAAEHCAWEHPEHQAYLDSLCQHTHA